MSLPEKDITQKVIQESESISGMITRWTTYAFVRTNEEEDLFRNLLVCILYVTNDAVRIWS